MTNLRADQRSTHTEFETVASFNDPEDAELLVARLREQGVDACLEDERKLQRYAFISKPLAGIRLQVAKEHFETAKHQLERWDAEEGALQHAVRCPECGSSRVEYPQFSRKSFIPNSVLGFFMALGFVPKSFYCQQCHFTWSPSEKVEQPKDLLGWPVRDQARTVKKV